MRGRELTLEVEGWGNESGKGPQKESRNVLNGNDPVNRRCMC